MIILLNGDELKGLVIIYLNRINDWQVVTGTFYCTSVNFINNENLINNDHFNFKMNPFNDIVQFTLLDSEGKLIWSQGTKTV